VFGFVLPQTLLHSQQASELRQLLLRDYEISEISLFADKVFRYGEPESTVIIGRRFAQNATRHFAARYQRIREGQVAEFSRTYAASSKMVVNRERLLATEDASLLVPELDDLWQALSAMKRLEVFADIGKGLEHRSVDDPKRPPATIVESPVRKDGLTAGFSAWSESQVTHELPRTSWLSLDEKVIRRPGSGAPVGIAQVLLNYARVSREAWCLKALIDEKGHPVTSDFSVARPRSDQLSLAVLWGLLNSALANAYAYCHSSKRHVLVGDMREMPIPNLAACDLAPLKKAVSEYLAAARATPSTKPQPLKRSAQRNKSTDQIELFGGEAEASTSDAESEHLKFLHWRVDAEVLRLYNLPPKLERQLLDLFSGVRRRGVPFVQTEYFPKGYADLDRLSDLLAITVDWEKTNRRRAKLMDLEDKGRLTPAQAEELANLQRLADALIGLIEPWKPDEVDRAVERAKQRGVWKE
jgi:hypothetical protein